MSKVAITGMGIISAIGNSVEENLNALLNGVSGISTIENIDTIHSNSIKVGEIKMTNLELSRLLDLPADNNFSRTALLGLFAAKQAVKNAGIERIGVGFGKPLLDGKIVPNLFFRTKCPSDDGIGTICPNEKFCSNGVGFFLFQIGNREAVVFSFQIRTDGIAVDFRTFRNNGFQPQVEFMSVQIDIKPLIMADEFIFQVDGLYGENLRIDQNILG